MMFYSSIPQKKGPPKSRSEAETYWGEEEMMEYWRSFLKKITGSMESSTTSRRSSAG